MTKSAEDMALEALLAAAGRIAPELNLEILKAAYALERAHRFDEDREFPQRSIQRLVESLVGSGKSE